MKVAMALLASAALFYVLVLLATWRESGRGGARRGQVQDGKLAQTLLPMKVYTTGLNGLPPESAQSTTFESISASGLSPDHQVRPFS